MKKNSLSDKQPNRNLSVEIFAAGLLLLFVHTLVSSFVRRVSLVNCLAFYTYHPHMWAWILIGLESIIALLLFLPSFRQYGFVGAGLMALWATYITWHIPFNPHDYGGFMNKINYKEHFYFYGLLISLSIGGLIASLQIVRARRKLTQSSTIFT